MGKIVNEKIYAEFKKQSANEENIKWENIISRQGPLYKKGIDIRTEFQRDYNRVIYCNAYKRLKHKTQVFFSPSNDHVCTRIEHVSHVESISYIIAKELGLNIELTKVISTAHDLGHSPFGHQGEHILNKIAKDDTNTNFWHERNGLFRVDNIELLEDPNGYKQNLNLTYAVRDGIISHCGEVNENSIKPRNEYINLYDYKSVNQYQPYTWEACVVKIADKISYVSRDIEDALRFNILSKNTIDEFNNILHLKNDIKLNNTNIINNLILDLLQNSCVSNGLNFSSDGLNLLNNLKQFNYKYIYGSERLQYGNKYFELIITTIYNVLKSQYNENTNKVEIKTKLYNNVITEFLDWLSTYSIQDYINPSQIQKLSNKKIYDLSKKEDYYLSILEYISGMTDNNAINTFNKIISF